MSLWTFTIAKMSGVRHVVNKYGSPLREERWLQGDYSHGSLFILDLYLALYKETNKFIFNKLEVH